jgi:flagellar protein FlaG
MAHASARGWAIKSVDPAEQDNIMVSEIQGASPNTSPSVNPRMQTPVQTAAAAVMPQKPQLVAPKPVDIQYDAGKIQQSLKEAVRLLNDQVTSKSQGLGFSYDETLKTPVITVRNTETGQVIRQIPNEDVLRVAHKLEDLKGLLYNAKA